VELVFGGTQQSLVGTSEGLLEGKEISHIIL